MTPPLPRSYTRTAKALHWGMATMIVPLLLLGEHTMGNHGARFLPTLHASAGFLLLVLLGTRVWWRLRNRPPERSGSAQWEKRAARLTHGLLYAAMALIPLTGWMAYTEHVRRSLGVAPASLFWLARIPLLPDFSINWHLVHNWGGKLALALIAIHALAALKHHFIDRDETLRRMLP